MRDEDVNTLPFENAANGARQITRFRLTVIDGPARDRVVESASERLSIGSDAINGLVVDDPTVSRFHCEISVDAGSVKLVDLESRNGTAINGVRVLSAFLEPGAVVGVGRSTIRFDISPESTSLSISAQPRFGSLLGQSLAMRTTFALLERVAVANATVLLEGETGCGKGAAAESIHRASARRHGPFIVIDCGALPAALLESELFGHERGAFTGAQTRRVGAFEAANGGTVFLDEIGELPAELQPKLLRVLENRHVRRVGSNAYVPVDVRVVTATHRDLRADVNAGRFRSDLFFRLAVVRITLPPLRARPEDIPLLAEHLLASLDATPAEIAAQLTHARVEELKLAPWPGNVRELRNHLERALVFPEAFPGTALGMDSPSELPPGAPPLANLPYAEAKEIALAKFEASYVEALLSRHGRKVAAASKASGLSREYLYRLMRKHGIGAG
jgi:DNA-binding NtrC family response regulator